MSFSSYPPWPPPREGPLSAVKGLRIRCPALVFSLPLRLPREPPAGVRHPLIIPGYHYLHQQVKFSGDFPLSYTWQLSIRRLTERRSSTPGLDPSWLEHPECSVRPGCG